MDTLPPVHTRSEIPVMEPSTGHDVVPAVLAAGNERSYERERRPVKLTSRAQASMMQGLYNAPGVYRNRFRPFPSTPTVPGNVTQVPPPPTLVSPTSSP
jgi:hypothetical protein